MNILHTIPSLIPESGGPSRSVPGLCIALSKQGLKVNLLSLDVGTRFGQPIIPPPELVDTTFVKNYFALGLRPLWNPGYRSTFRNLVREKGIDIIHDHGTWLPTNLIAASVAHEFNIPFVVSPRGMLEPWALQQKRLKKHLMWHLYQRHNLEAAQILHATSRLEAKNLRNLGLSTPIAIIPNGVNIPLQLSKSDRQKKERTLLFLSRIHPKKGLINLVHAIKKISPEGWQIIIAGPDEGGYQAEVESAVNASGLKNIFTFIGPVNDEDKWSLYQTADLFVLPTFSENFGIVVAEALASGMPVITTTGAPWQELVLHNCGWWVEPEIDPLAQAIQEAMMLTDEERRKMGQNGRTLVSERYSWSTIADQMISVYRWVLGLNPQKPQCLYT